MTDPRDQYRDPRMDAPYRDYEPGLDTRAPMRDAEARNTAWGWIAGVIAAIFIVAIVYGFSNNSSTTATNTSERPAETTGAAPARPAPPVNPATPSAPAPSAPAPSGAR